MGMLHALEPGHGKSFFAAYMVGNKLKWKEISMVIIGMLVAHFVTLSLIAILVAILFKDSEQLYLFNLIGPIIIILFGVYLFITERKHDHHVHHHHANDVKEEHDHAHDCSCDHDYDKHKHRHPAIAGILMGIIPCPSVLAPIMLSINYGISEKFIFILVYVLGMGIVLSTFIIALSFFSKDLGQFLNKVSGKFRPELVSALLIILIGVVYLVYNLNHAH